MSDDQVIDEVATVLKDQMLPGVVRTAVPSIAGYVTALLASWGLSIDAAWATRAVTVVAAVGYYALMRFWELKGKTWASRLLGSKHTPTFAPGGSGSGR